MTTRKTSLKRELSFAQRRLSFFFPNKKSRHEEGGGGAPSDLSLRLLERQGRSLEELQQQIQQQQPSSRPRVSFGDLETVRFNREDSSRSLTGGVTVSRPDYSPRHPQTHHHNNHQHQQEQSLRWGEQSQWQPNAAWGCSDNRTRPCRWESFTSSSGSGMTSLPASTGNSKVMFHPGSPPAPRKPTRRASPVLAPKPTRTSNVPGPPALPAMSPPASFSFSSSSTSPTVPHHAMAAPPKLPPRRLSSSSSSSPTTSLFSLPPQVHPPVKPSRSSSPTPLPVTSQSTPLNYLVS